jgi:filamentous hemagglutinin
LALALANPAAAVNAGIITVETAAAIATDSMTPGLAIEGLVQKAGNAANTAIDGANVWGLSPIARGVTIESQLAKTEYSAANGWYQVGAENNGYFPLVDFQHGHTLVSLKSVDTTGSTWLPRMEGVIDQLGSSNATVNGSPANMVLDLRVQPGGAAAAQSLISYGARQGVTVRIKVYP